MSEEERANSQSSRLKAVRARDRSRGLGFVRNVVGFGLLDLAHRGTAATQAAAHVDATAAGHGGEDESGEPGEEAEEEECCRGLGFAAAAFGVGRAVGDVV